MSATPPGPARKEARLVASANPRLFTDHLSGNRQAASTHRSAGAESRCSVGRHCLRLCHHGKAFCRALFNAQRQSFGLLHTSSNAAASRFSTRVAPVTLGNFLQRNLTAVISSGLASTRRGRLASWSILPWISGPLLPRLSGHALTGSVVPVNS
jgi:hypothetical protein